MTRTNSPLPLILLARHTIDIGLNRASRGRSPDLRVELANPPQGGAQVQIVTGK